MLKESIFAICIIVQVPIQPHWVTPDKPSEAYRWIYDTEVLLPGAGPSFTASQREEHFIAALSGSAEPGIAQKVIADIRECDGKAGEDAFLLVTSKWTTTDNPKAVLPLMTPAQRRRFFEIFRQLNPSIALRNNELVGAGLSVRTLGRMEDDELSELKATFKVWRAWEQEAYQPSVFPIGWRTIQEMTDLVHWPEHRRSLQRLYDTQIRELTKPELALWKASLGKRVDAPLNVDPWEPARMKG